MSTGRLPSASCTTGWLGGVHGELGLTETTLRDGTRRTLRG